MTNENQNRPLPYFADPDRALAFMSSVHWPDGKVCCPRCNASDVTFMASCRRWLCKGCRSQFSVKQGTIFEESPLGLDKWLPAVWMIINAKNGISSCELSRALGVTQKTAWFMLHRIRLALQNGSFDKLSGEIEVDETFVGGKYKFMNNRQRRKSPDVSGPGGKAVVMGLLERKGRVIAKAVVSTQKRHLKDHIFQHVEPGSAVYTDTMPSYNDLHSHYAHEQINHAVCYAKGAVHTTRKQCRCGWQNGQISWVLERRPAKALDLGQLLLVFP